MAHFMTMIRRTEKKGFRMEPFFFDVFISN